MTLIEFSRGNYELTIFSKSVLRAKIQKVKLFLAELICILKRYSIRTLLKVIQMHLLTTKYGMHSVAKLDKTWINSSGFSTYKINDQKSFWSILAIRPFSYFKVIVDHA